MSDICKRPMKGLLISDIKLTLDEAEQSAIDEARLRLKRAGVNPAQLCFCIYKKSVDARKKNDIRLVYSVAAYAKDTFFADAQKLAKHGI